MPTEAEGAWPNGTRIEKAVYEPGDAHRVGAEGLVVGSIGPMPLDVLRELRARGGTAPVGEAVSVSSLTTSSRSRPAARGRCRTDRGSASPAMRLSARERGGIADRDSFGCPCPSLLPTPTGFRASLGEKLTHQKTGERQNMAKRTSKDKGNTIEIDTLVIEQGRAHFCVLGSSPLLLNRMSEKAKRQLLYPSGRKNAVEKATTLKHDPFEEFQAAPYRIASSDAPTLLGLRPPHSSAPSPRPRSTCRVRARLRSGA